MGRERRNRTAEEMRLAAPAQPAGLPMCLRTPRLSGRRPTGFGPACAPAPAQGRGGGGQQHRNQEQGSGCSRGQPAAGQHMAAQLLAWRLAPKQRREGKACLVGRGLAVRQRRQRLLHPKLDDELLQGSTGAVQPRVTVAVQQYSHASQWRYRYRCSTKASRCKVEDPVATHPSSPAEDWPAGTGMFPTLGRGCGSYMALSISSRLRAAVALGRLSSSTTRGARPPCRQAGRQAASEQWEQQQPPAAVGCHHR